MRVVPASLALDCSDALRPPFRRSRSCCTHRPVCPPIPCSIQTLAIPSLCQKYPWPVRPRQPAAPEPACLPPCSRLAAYLLPSSWNPSWLALSNSTHGGFPASACVQFRTSSMKFDRALKSPCTSAPNATDLGIRSVPVQLPSTAVRARSLLARFTSALHGAFGPASGGIAARDSPSICPSTRDLRFR